MPLDVESRNPVVDRDAEEIQRLEELWRASPSEAPATPAPTRTRQRPWLGALLTLGWLGFLVSVFFEPAPDHPNTPLWGEYLILSFWLTLLGAAILGIARTGRRAYAAATIAGVLGIGLAVACRATEHHLGGWWLYELGATGALTALGAAGLLRSRPRASSDSAI